MSKVKFFFKKLLSPDIQALIEADYITTDGALTDDGVRALNQELFVENQPVMVERAKARIAERKEAEEKSKQ